MKGPHDFDLSDEEKERVAKMIELIEERAASSGAFPVIFGPARLDQRVFDAVMRESQNAGWVAYISDQGMLVIDRPV